MARIGQIKVTSRFASGDIGYETVFNIKELDIDGYTFTSVVSTDEPTGGATFYTDLDWTNTSELELVFLPCDMDAVNTYEWIQALTEVPDGDVAIEFPISIANGGTGATTAAQALTNLGAASATALDALSDTVAGKANSSHTHTIANITNLQTTLDGKADASHTHNYAASNHTHSNYAASSHTHAIADVTNLQSTLDGKASTDHTHVTPCCTITGSASSQSLTAGTMTRVSLNTFVANTDTNCFSAYDNGVKVAESGYYQISASAYMTCSATSGIRVIHVHQNSTEIATVRSEEGRSYASQGGIATAPKVVYLNAGDVIYLKVRSMVSDGTLVPNNCATYLSIVKM